MPRIIKGSTGAMLAPLMLTALTMTFVLPAGAQTPLQHPANGVPDSWVGQWVAAPANDMPPGMKVDITQQYDRNHPDDLYGAMTRMVSSHLKPWAKLLQEDTDWDLDDGGQVCRLSGIFRQGSVGRGGFTLLQSPGKIFIITNVDEVNHRTIRFSPHPEGLLPSYNGDSRAHWEPDGVLVIDSIGFNDRTFLESDREPHTEELHLIERLRPVEYKGNTYIEYRVFVDDRKALKSPYFYTRVIMKAKPADMAAGAAGGGGRGGAGAGNGGGGVCNESDGKLIFEQHRDEILDQHEKELQEYIKKVNSGEITSALLE